MLATFHSMNRDESYSPFTFTIDSVNPYPDAEGFFSMTYPTGLEHSRQINIIVSFTVAEAGYNPRFELYNDTTNPDKGVAWFMDDGYQQPDMSYYIDGTRFTFPTQPRQLGLLGTLSLNTYESSSPGGPFWSTIAYGLNRFKIRMFDYLTNSYHTPFQYFELTYT